MHTHWASVRGFSATTAVVGFFISVPCSGLNPVTLSMPHLQVLINFHAK